MKILCVYMRDDASGERVFTLYRIYNARVMKGGSLWVDTDDGDSVVVKATLDGTYARRPWLKEGAIAEFIAVDDDENPVRENKLP